MISMFRSGKGKIGLFFLFVAFLLLGWLLFKIYISPDVHDESEITLPKVLAARSVCKQVPRPEDFEPISATWGQRVGAPHAWYRTSFTTRMSFDQIYAFYSERLPSLGFEGGYKVESVREWHIKASKDDIPVTIGYRTSYYGLPETIKALLGYPVWNVYIDCDAGQKNIQ